MRWTLWNSGEPLLSNRFLRGAAVRDNGVRIVGHPFAPIGMGQHLRSVWRSFNEVGGDAKIVDIYGPFGEPDPELVAELAPVISRRLCSGGVNIYCINGDEVENSLKMLPDSLTEGSYNIIYPLWELEKYPKEWAEQLERFDEVWAPSTFIQGSLSSAVAIPVVHMPLACEPRRRALRSRRYFGIRESAYAFFFSFDFLSYIERKNPFAVIEAFHALIDKEPFADTVLVIKTNNSAQRPEMKARFEEAIAPLQGRVRVIDRTLTEPEIQSLVWLTDCFVSLHRSEGYGFGLAEAMSFGKPVIATAYSGNMDFCTEQAAILIPYRLIGLRSGDYPHWQGQHWADPEVEVATEVMRQLIRDPGYGREIGSRARTYLATDFGYLPTGLRYLNRISQAGASVTAGGLDWRSPRTTPGEVMQD